MVYVKYIMNQVLFIADDPINKMNYTDTFKNFMNQVTININNTMKMVNYMVYLNIMIKTVILFLLI